MTRREFFIISFGVFFLLSRMAFAETIELVTYYPAPGGSAADENPQFDSLRIGEGYENLAIPEDGTVEITGNLRLPPATATTGIIFSGVNRFIHRFGNSNFFAGTNAGNFTLTGSANVGIGTNAMQSLTDGTQNVAVGIRAMQDNTRGQRNSAFGMESLQSNTTGGFNTGMGHNTLFLYRRFQQHGGWLPGIAEHDGQR